MSRLLARVMKLLSRILKNRTLTIRQGPARGLKRRFGQGFKPKLGSTAEEDYIQALDLGGKTVFDVGAYIGIMTLFFARAAGPGGRVVSFEPNPANYEELRSNVELNGFDNVCLLKLGVGAEPGAGQLALDPIYPSRGSLAPSADGERLSVEVATLDGLLHEARVPVPQFVKIDVEGLEDDVLAGMAGILEAHRPELFIELHGRASQSLMSALLDRGYRLHHVETQADWNGPEPPETRGGHLHCTS
jgi:FkbM family methyltransferase